jgi:hypothetical protein
MIAAFLEVARLDPSEDRVISRGVPFYLFWTRKP